MLMRKLHRRLGPKSPPGDLAAGWAPQRPATQRRL